MSKFGLIQPTLIQQIRKILDQYPDDGQILKELIQNAEDAGAKKIKFLFDHHSYKTEKLSHPELDKFQGPALYAYNDAKFTEADWEGLGMLCDSIKEKDPTKVGRFGLGFKSVFHMTDLPSVISGDSLGIIDPHEKYFSDTNGKRSGRRWNLNSKNDRKYIQKFSDQFAPYKGIFDCTQESFRQGCYQGTLFRLPLRQKASKLSDTLYSVEKMKGLFECFEKDAHLILLFLKNLEQIEIYERDGRYSEPRKVFQVEISNDCLRDVREAREEFNAEVQNNISSLSYGSFSEVKMTFHLTIETVHYHDDGKTHSSTKSKYPFVVTLFFSGSDVSHDIRELMTDESLSYLPLLGVALPLMPQLNKDENDSDDEVYLDYDEDDDDEIVVDDDYLNAVVVDDDDVISRYVYDDRYADDYYQYEYEDMEDSENDNKRDSNKFLENEPQGHLFCFLPLPSENKSLTGLPVHVNGFFALSQNRRHLKWPSADQDEANLTDKSLLWNKGLLQEVLPKAYAELILYVTSYLSREESHELITTSDVYGAWPDITKVDVKWKDILNPFFELLLDYEVLYSDANGGVWCKVEDVLLDNLEKSEKSRKVVVDVLNKTGTMIVTAPENVKTAVEQYRTVRYITPRILRNSFKKNPSCYSDLSYEDKILLLNFVLKDSDFKDIEGLELLPLSDKTFTTFQRRSFSVPIYIDSAEHPKSLLPRLQRMFLNTDIDDSFVLLQLKKTVKTGHTQLCCFNKEAVKRHLHEELPCEWLESEDDITWYPGRSNQPTIKWLEELWLYFGRHYNHTTSDLDAFLGLPLVPVSSLNKQKNIVKLAKIRRSSSLVLTSFNGESIDESVSDILRFLGLTVLDDIPDFLLFFPRLVPNIVNPASPKGVLNALGIFIANSQNKETLLQMRRLHPNNIRSFRIFLSSISSVTSNQEELLRELPLFETFAGSGGKPSRFVSSKEVNIGAPIDGLPDVSVLTDLLDLTYHSSRALAHLLGIKPITQIGMLKIMLDDALHNKYSKKELDKLVDYTLERFGMLHGDDLKCIKEKLQCLPFVACSDNSRKKPGELYDPEDALLRQIFEDEDVFPKERSQYSHPDVLVHLRKLGLKGKISVSISDIVRSAKLVNKSRSIEKANTKSKAILTFLEQTPSLLEQKYLPGRKNLRSFLCSIVWIPVLLTSPERYPSGLPLKKSKTGYFACPKDVTSHEYINLVGSVKPLVNIRSSSRVSTFFGWDQKPSLQDVVRHLQNVKNALFQDTNRWEELQTMKAFEELYCYFQNSLKDERDEVKEYLSSENFILVQKHLLKPHQVAFSSQVNYLPYLCQLSPDYKHKFCELFESVGVRESFELYDYIKTIQKIKSVFGENSITKELVQVTNVLSTLAGVMKRNGVTASEAIEKYGNIFLPDSNGIMKPSTNVCVKDCYWMPNERGINYVNERIPPCVSITLGANTRREETLRRHTTRIRFGQKEKLTNRLKRILTGYPCDESIMKELLQNADDAKASKICFIKDPRQHPSEKVFEECWKPLQGPALCVYNDAPFTESDIEGIQNLGEGNKGDDPNKTGQYGVGFNAVYHLTDAPTFISQGDEIGEVMCVFDPLLKYAPGADASNPGVMYKDLLSLRETFTDVFPCYLDQHLPLNNASMFRFPLRNEDMASTSTISNKAMTIEKLDKLLNDFKEELLEVLLFVNNVKEISICQIDRKTGNLKESYHVQASLSSEDEKKRKGFAGLVSEIGKSLQKGEMSIHEIPAYQVTYVLDLKNSRGLNQKWFIVQRIGFENKAEIPENFDVAYKKGDLGLLPRGGVASLISSSEHHKSLQGKAFCFLPLPFETGLPVHINGHFALNHEDRRSLWRDNKGGYRSNWNDTLLRQVVAPCYVTLLAKVRQHLSLQRDADGKTCISGNREMGESFLLYYLKFFPSFNVEEKYWRILCKEVYCYMNAKDFRLLPVLRQENQGKKSSTEMTTIEWLPPTGKGCNHAFFDNLEDFFRDDTEELQGKRKSTALQKKELLRDTLLDVGFNLLFMPTTFYSCFKTSGVNVSLVSPKDVNDFFQTYDSSENLCDVGSLPSRIECTKFKSINSLLAVLKYCKQDEDFLYRLEGLPLLLTEDNNLRVFKQSHKVYLSWYHDLLPSCSSMFVHCKVFNSVFQSDDELNDVFKVFDIAAFARLLPKEMKESHYKTTNRHVEWHPEKKGNQIPNSQWIWHVWRFFSNHIEKIVKTYDEDQRSKRPLNINKPYHQVRELEKRNEQEDRMAKKRLTEEALDPINDWCLLPAFEVDSHSVPVHVRHILVPLSMAHTLFYLEDSRRVIKDQLKDALRKLVLPELNSQLLYIEREARRIVAHLDDPNSVLTALVQKLNIDCHALKRLREYDCITLLEYFNDQLSQLDLTSAEKQLKKLPLYPSIHDDIISISGKQAFVLSQRIPKDDMHMWQETSEIVFLKESIILKNLYEFLDCHCKDEVDVYCDVIFENFGDMREEARLKHVTFARKLLKELENIPVYASKEEITQNKAKLSKLFEALSKLNFIQAKDGTLKTASSFYDPSNKVFKVMFEEKQEMFPSAPFCDSEWTLFLRKIGLIHQVSNKQFLQFAKEVETEAKTRQDNETRRKSETLISCLFDTENVVNNQLLDDVKMIFFIFPQRVQPGLQCLHEQYGSRETGLPCICFQGAVTSRNSSITWTSANVLPDHANPLSCKNFDLTINEKDEISRQLHILHNPTVEMVVIHCKNICNVLCQMNFTKDYDQSVDIGRKSSLIITVMKSVYEYLQNNYDGNEDVIDELQNIPCIVVDDGKRFVYPNQVAIDITSDQEIKPYLYKIPLKLATFANLFESLGTTNTVTCVQYAAVLENIYKESFNEMLDPNERVKAFKATKGFFETIDNEDQVEDIAISSLYLPGVKRNPNDLTMNMVFLRLSSNIIYNDAQHFKERIRKFDNLVLVHLSECELNITDDYFLVKKLPKPIHPRMLTTCVHETLIEDSQPFSQSSSTAQELRQLLTSSEFCHGLVRLIRHADYKSDVETRLDIPNIVEESLKCIQVYSVPHLRTRLVFNGKTIPDSEADVFCFEEKTEDGEQEIWNIYIEKEAELNRYISVVAEVVDRITGHLLKTMLVHLPTMLSSKPYEIKDLLDGLKIREDGSFLETEATCLPTLGNFIHIADHHLLVDDFTVFSPGEYVGYEIDDPSLRGEDGTPTYIYAIIVEEVTEDEYTDPSSRRYRINIGKDREFIVVDAADLYKFFRQKRTSSESLELEIYGGHQSMNETEDEKPPMANLVETKREVKRIIENAWKLFGEKRKKIIKRLFLKWHPDKNPGNEFFCTEVFKFIQSEIRRLERGQGEKGNSLGTFYEKWQNRARCHREQRTSFFKGGSHSYASSSEYRRNPQPGEATRWFKQAKADLDAASNDVSRLRASYEWACFKCHQSAEKALKAAQYSIDADKTSTHSLTSIAQYLGNSTLQTLTFQLESLVGNSMRMRYPDQVRYPGIPHNVYTGDMASNAIELTSSIIREVKSRYINKD